MSCGYIWDIVSDRIVECEWKHWMKRVIENTKDWLSGRSVCMLFCINKLSIRRYAIYEMYTIWPYIILVVDCWQLKLLWYHPYVVIRKLVGSNSKVKCVKLFSCPQQPQRSSMLINKPNGYGVTKLSFLVLYSRYGFQLDSRPSDTTLVKVPSVSFH